MCLYLNHFTLTQVLYNESNVLQIQFRQGGYCKTGLIKFLKIFYDRHHSIVGVSLFKVLFTLNFDFKRGGTSN